MMRVESAKVEAFTIYDDDGARRLDPVLVILQDLGGGQGRIVLECYGEAWSAYWGAMGNRNIKEFFATTSVDYLVNRLWPAQVVSRKKHREDYLRRIVESAREALARGCFHFNIDKSFVIFGDETHHIKKCVDCGERIRIAGPVESVFSPVKES